ncbi:hypothetical protein Tco_0048759 [Tanacetum coccineum]
MVDLRIMETQMIVLDTSDLRIVYLMLLERFIQPTSSNARNNATVQDVVVQDVRGRYNANNQGRPFQRNNARGNVVTGNVGGQNRVGNMNAGQDSDYLKDKMLLMNAYKNGAVLDEEQLLFLAGEQVTNFDDDVDDLALNVDVFEGDQCDAFDSDVDEA